MSDNRRVYRHIMSSLKQLYPTVLKGHKARHLNTLAAFIAGIVQSKHTHLEKIARKIPEQTQVESRVKKFTRFLQNEKVDVETFFIPFIMPLIAALSVDQVVTIAMDGSTTGRECITLMVSIIYKERAIPIAWVTVKGKKGHLPETVHLQLLGQLNALFPDDAKVVFLGDGEFDGINLQRAITYAGWEYVCRTAKNRIVIADGDRFGLNEIAISSGDCIPIFDVGYTDAAYGPVLVIVWWRQDDDAPIYLVTNFDCVDEACLWYLLRFRIETFFSDQKSRGFNLHKSHLTDPKRIARFLMATCLAYIWVIYLGVKARHQTEVMRRIHRTDRCDLSLFQLGLRYLEDLLNLELDLFFNLILPSQFCVR